VDDQLQTETEVHVQGTVHTG